MTAIKVKVGDTFRSVIADCNALWRVDRVNGDVAHCHVVNEPWEHNGRTYDSDFAGQRNVFYVSEVAARIQQAREWEQRARANDEFFDSLEVGAIVHYNNGFGQFVRCQVVVLDETIRTGTGTEYPAGTKLLQPVALVGNWKPHDLPRIDPDGVERIPYHADKVINRTGAWRPSQGCVFESPDYSSGYRRQGDPTTMPEIDLTPMEVAA